MLQRNGANGWWRAFSAKDNVCWPFEAVDLYVEVSEILEMAAAIRQPEPHPASRPNAKAPQDRLGNGSEGRACIHQSVKCDNLAFLTDQRDGVKESAHIVIIPYGRPAGGGLAARGPPLIDAFRDGWYYRQ